MTGRAYTRKKGSKSIRERNDNFSLSIMELIRARHFSDTLTANNPFLNVTQALNVFMRYCHSLCPLEADAFIEICCRDLVREFSPQRLDEIQEWAKPQFPEDLIEYISYFALTLEILAASADKSVPGLRDHFLSKFCALFNEEGSLERLAELRKAAATTVH